MADQNIKDFTVNWILFGLLFFSLMIFTLAFVYENNSTALGNTEDKLTLYSTNLSSTLQGLEESTNEQINISSVIESEDLEAGSRVSASNSYGFLNTAGTFLDSSKDFIGWMLTGTIGQIIVGVLGGIFGITILFFIFKLGRSLF